MMMYLHMYVRLTSVSLCAVEYCHKLKYVNRPSQLQDGFTCFLARWSKKHLNQVFSLGLVLYRIMVFISRYCFFVDLFQDIFYVFVHFWLLFVHTSTIDCLEACLQIIRPISINHSLVLLTVKMDTGGGAYHKI